MPNIQVIAQPIGVRQPEPPEGRKAYPLQGVNFVTGNEVFEWDSNRLGNAEPSAIMGAWIDASALAGLAATDGVTIIFNPNSSNAQKVFVPAGSQGYVVVVQQKPVRVLISISGTTGLVPVILYNYNPLFTGSVNAAVAPTGSASGSGSATGGSVTGRNSPIQSGSGPGRPR